MTEEKIQPVVIVLESNVRFTIIFDTILSHFITHIRTRKPLTSLKKKNVLELPKALQLIINICFVRGTLNVLDKLRRISGLYSTMNNASVHTLLMT